MSSQSANTPPSSTIRKGDRVKIRSRCNVEGEVLAVASDGTSLALVKWFVPGAGDAHKTVFTFKELVKSP